MKRVAVVFAAALVLVNMAVGLLSYVQAKVAPPLFIEMLDVPLDFEIEAQAQYDNIVVDITVKNWRSASEITLSFCGDHQSVDGKTEIVKSRQILLNAQKGNCARLEAINYLQDGCQYRIVLSYFDRQAGRRFCFARIKFTTPEIPRVDVETGDCQELETGGFKACAIVRSTGINDTLYLTIEVAKTKEDLENDNYSQIEIFQYGGLASEGTYLIEAQGLQKDATYFYRVVGRNGSGSDTADIKQAITLK